MKSIKNSFANCSVCDLLDAPSCIAETNCKTDLSQVDVVFIAENPGKDEVKRGVPLIGRAGQMFRKYFKKFGIDKQKYLLTNTVLCQTLEDDGTTGNPTPEVIERCKVNCMELVKVCNPKLLVIMGTSPMSAFGIAKSGITELHGDIVEWIKANGGPSKLKKLRKVIKSLAAKQAKKKGAFLHPFKKARQSGMPDNRLFDGQPSNSARTC